MHWLKDRCVEIMPRLKGLTGWKGSCVKRMYRLGSSCAESIYGLKGWIVEGVHGKKQCIGWIDFHGLKGFMSWKHTWGVRFMCCEDVSRIMFVYWDLSITLVCQSHHVCVLRFEYHPCLSVSSCLCIDIRVPFVHKSHYVCVLSSLGANKWPSKGFMVHFPEQRYGWWKSCFVLFFQSYHRKYLSAFQHYRTLYVRELEWSAMLVLSFVLRLVLCFGCFVLLFASFVIYFVVCRAII